MNNNHNPPLPLLHRVTTVTQILHQSTAVFFTRHHLLPILFLSFIQLVFRNELETYSHSLTSFIDDNPSITSFFPPKPTTPNHHLHLTEDNDFIGVINQNYFQNIFKPKPESNATPIILDSFNTRFSNAKLSFKSSNYSNTEIEHQDWSAFYNRGVLYVSYGFMILLYVLSQSIIHGIVFVLVVNHVLKNRNRFLSYTFRRGEILGQRRVWWLILLKWELMQNIVQVCSLWFQGRDDHYSVFKIVVKLSFLPFSIVFPVVEGFEKEIYRFTLSYTLCDLIISFLWNIWVWVIMADSRMGYGDSCGECFYLFSLSFYPAFFLKSLEYIVTASVTRSILTQVFGEFLAEFFRSFMAIYFMVVWLMYYFSVKSMDAHADGIPFGKKQFEDMLSDNR